MARDGNSGPAKEEEKQVSDSGRAIGDERERQVDFVNRPPHYKQHPTGIECIQVVEHLPFLEGNIIKYVWRWRDKGGVEDLEKAKWYLDRLIENERKKK